MMTLEEFKKRAEETDDWAPKWGYEMTIKLPETDNENCMWAISLYPIWHVIHTKRNAFLSHTSLYRTVGDPSGLIMIQRLLACFLYLIPRRREQIPSTEGQILSSSWA